MDNFSAHKHEKVMKWVHTRSCLTLHFTPTYASWLNQVVIWFSIFSRDVLKGGFGILRGTSSNIMGYIKSYNQKRAKRFPWTYTVRPS